MYTDVKIGHMKLLKIDSRLPRPYTCITVGLSFHHFPFTASSVYVGAQMSQQQQCTHTLPLHTYCKMFCSRFRCSGKLHCVVCWVVLNVLKDQSFEMSGTTQCHIPEDLNPQQHCCEHLKTTQVL
jgi:hypothetical protein